MGRVSSSFETESLTTLHWLAILLAIATGVLHLYAGAVEGRIPVALAGVGFFVAVVVFLLDYRRSMLYLVGIGYTAVQIPLWYVVKTGEYTMVGYVDKSIQVIFVVVLVYLYLTERKAATAGRDVPAT